MRGFLANSVKCFDIILRAGTTHQIMKYAGCFAMLVKWMKEEQWMFENVDGM